MTRRGSHILLCLGECPAREFTGRGWDMADDARVKSLSEFILEIVAFTCPLCDPCDLIWSLVTGKLNGIFKIRRNQVVSFVNYLVIFIAIVFLININVPFDSLIRGLPA